MAEAFIEAEALRAATFIRHVELHETLGSTNDRAAELASERSMELPALVAARLQSAGRGRGRNPWWSAEGALTFSVLLDSAAMGIGVSDWPQLSLATAVAVCDALMAEAPGASVALKWPNDVLIDGRKVCGILIESPGGAAPAKDLLIIGVGINVNNSWRAASTCDDAESKTGLEPIRKPSAEGGPSQGGWCPSQFAPQTPQIWDSPRRFSDRLLNGIALCDVTGKRHALQSVLVRTLRAAQDRFHQLASKDPQLPSAWRRLCWLTGKDVSVQTSGGVVSGRCAGIDTEAALTIESEAGVRRLRSGSVRLND